MPDGENRKRPSDVSFFFRCREPEKILSYIKEVTSDIKHEKIDNSDIKSENTDTQDSNRKDVIVIEESKSNSSKSLDSPNSPKYLDSLNSPNSLHSPNSLNCSNSPISLDSPQSPKISQNVAVEKIRIPPVMVDVTVEVESPRSVKTFSVDPQKTTVQGLVQMASRCPSQYVVVVNEAALVTRSLLLARVPKLLTPGRKPVVRLVPTATWEAQELRRAERIQSELVPRSDLGNIVDVEDDDEEDDEDTTPSLSLVVKTDSVSETVAVDSLKDSPATILQIFRSRHPSLNYSSPRLLFDGQNILVQPKFDFGDLEDGDQLELKLST